MAYRDYIDEVKSEEKDKAVTLRKSIWGVEVEVSLPISTLYTRTKQSWCLDLGFG